jgi:uncharacterized membrane protein YeaQ/YmgE (transglycosylase-associated protein family)
MFIMAWLAVGIVSGFVLGQLVNRSKQSLLFDCLLGVIGAVSGGWVFHRFLGGTPMTEITAYGFGACMIGGALCVLLYHELFAEQPN